jgi:hypothetical protein
MVRRKRKNLIFFLCLQAMAVAIICFGSLINFHQYKIWGKPLIPNFVGYKRDIEKYSKTASFSKLSHANHHLQNNFQGNDLDFPVGIVSDLCASGTFLLSDFSQKSQASDRISPSGLRGPPIS